MKNSGAQKYLELTRNHQDQWVAWDKEATKIVAHDKSLEKLEKKLLKKGKEVVVRRVLPVEKAYAPIGSF